MLYLFHNHWFLNNLIVKNLHGYLSRSSHKNNQNWLKIKSVSFTSEECIYDSNFTIVFKTVLFITKSCIFLDLRFLIFFKKSLCVPHTQGPRRVRWMVFLTLGIVHTEVCEKIAFPVTMIMFHWEATLAAPSPGLYHQHFLIAQDTK